MVRFGVLASLLAVGCQTPAPRFHEDPNAKGPYSGAVDTGDLVFVAGKIGDATRPLEQQADQAIDAVEAELAWAGLTLADVVSVTVYLADIELYARFNRVYAARFARPYPARTVVAVSGIPAGAKVEIQVVARR